jgi:hypothetical protein
VGIFSFYSQAKDKRKLMLSALNTRNNINKGLCLKEKLTFLNSATILIQTLSATEKRLRTLRAQTRQSKIHFAYFVIVW